MNNHQHRNHWCANAWVGAPWACGDHHHHSKENFEVDASDMYASQDLAIEGFDCNGKTITNKSCGGLNEKNCEKSVTTNTGAPAPYLNCRFHKGKCNRTVKGEGNYCPPSCEPEVMPGMPPYDTDLSYKNGSESRGSVQSLAKFFQQEAEDNTCENIRTIFENSGVVWGGDDLVSQNLQNCDSYYQRTNVNDPKIGLCKLDETLNTCVASDFVDFIPTTGKLECPSPSSS